MARNIICSRASLQKTEIQYNFITFLPLKVNGIKQEESNEFLPGAAAVSADPVGYASFSSLIEHGGFFQFYSN